MGEDALKAFALFTFGVLVVGCSSKPPIDTKRILSVHIVMQNLDELNGKAVKVAGFLPVCGVYDCSLFANEQQARDFWRIANDPHNKEKLPEFVEIGSVRGFDAKAGPLAAHDVIVSGQVTNECKQGCTDRGPNLLPTDIMLSPPKPTERTGG
jgi:hypothetical protein